MHVGIAQTEQHSGNAPTRPVSVLRCRFFSAILRTAPYLSALVLEAFSLAAEEAERARGGLTGLTPLRYSHVDRPVPCDL